MLAIQPHISTGEAAKRLGIDRRTILRWVKRGRIRAYTMPSGTNHVLVEDVDKILAQQSEGAPRSDDDAPEGGAE